MRDLGTAVAEALAESVVNISLLADFEFDSQTVYMWTGIGNLIIDGNTYIGVGNLVGISEIRESQNLEANGLAMSLSGVSSTLVSVALQETFQGRICRLWLAVTATENRIAQEGDEGAILQEDGSYILLENELVGAPYLLFTGMMDTMEINDDGKSAIITLNAENVLLQLKRSKVRRYTDEDQKAEFPQDRGLEFIASLQDRQIVWGR